MLIINIKSREICLERDNLEWTTALKSGEKGLNKVLKCKLKKKKKETLQDIFFLQPHHFSDHAGSIFRLSWGLFVIIPSPI